MSSAPPSAALDGVWITDSVLALAFARYYCCSPSSSCIPLVGSASPPQPSVTLASGYARRFASNVPGPLESRRRLGKRQMTDQLSLQLALNPGGALPPAWALPNMPDLTQWRWSPPRDAPSLLSRQTDTAERGLNQRQDDALVAWNQPDAPTSTSVFPSFGMPRWLADLGAVAKPEDAVVNGPEAGVSSTDGRARSVAVQPLFAKLHSWDSPDPNGAWSDAEVAHQLADLCGELEALLRLAALSADETREAFGLLWDGLVRHAGPDGPATYATMLFSSVLHGIAACRLVQAADLGADFWHHLFVRVGQLPADSQTTAAAAADILLATPPLFLDHVVDLLPAHLCAILIHPFAPSTAASASAKMARVLEHVDPKHQAQWMDATTSLLLAAAGQSDGLLPPAPVVHHAHHTMASPYGGCMGTPATRWLLILAHMPQVRQAQLYKAMSQLHAAAGAGGAWHMRREDLCELLLAQWMSRGYVTQRAQHAFRRTMAAVRAATVSEVTEVTQNIDMTKVAEVAEVAEGTKVAEAECTGVAESDDHPAALAVLALAVFRSKHSRANCVALYASLLRSLRLLGRDHEIVPSVAALLVLVDAQPPTPPNQAALVVPPVAFFEAVAWATDDVHAALRLHELYVYASHTTASSAWSALPFAPAPVPAPLWSVGFWDKFADRLAAALDQGSLTPGQVSHALDLAARAKAARLAKKVQSKTSSHSSSASSPRVAFNRRLGAPTVALAEKLAVHYALAPNLAPRSALRGVEQCRALLVAHGQMNAPRTSVSSPIILRALFHLITRDLEAAQPGRTSRLRWFLHIVEREHSEAAALSSSRALERWREAAKRIRRAEEQHQKYQPQQLHQQPPTPPSLQEPEANHADN